ncbi:MAG: hypothetical protein AB8A66_07560 [Prochlorococcus sp.]
MAGKPPAAEIAKLARDLRDRHTERVDGITPVLRIAYCLASHPRTRN